MYVLLLVGSYQGLKDAIIDLVVRIGRDLAQPYLIRGQRRKHYYCRFQLRIQTNYSVQVSDFYFLEHKFTSN